MLQEVGVFLLWLIAFLFRQVFKGAVWGLFSKFFNTDFSVSELKNLDCLRVWLVGYWPVGAVKSRVV